MKRYTIFLTLTVLLLSSVSLRAQVTVGTNTLGPSSSAIGDTNTVNGIWSTAIGLTNFIYGDQSFASGARNSVSGNWSAAFGRANNVTSMQSAAFGINNTVSAPFSFAFGHSTKASGFNSFVFGYGQAPSLFENTKSNSFLVGFRPKEPGLMVSRNTDGPIVGIGTDDPQDRLDIRLGDKQEVIIQSEVPNTFGGISFRHSDGTENWRIRSFSNFPGGYGNILGIVGAGGGDFWIAAEKTLIGSFFDFDDCTDCDEYELFVRKGIRTEKVKVDVASGVWADYVFDPDYQLKPLSEVEAYIQKNHHLPGVPSATQMESEGLDVARTDALLLQKIEELTLYIIALEKKIKAQAAAIESLRTH